MRTRAAVMVLGLVGMGCVRVAAGQAASAASPGNPRRVMLDVVVTDGAGKTVPGLTALDFTITDNKQPVTPVSFDAKQQGAAADTSVCVMLVLDNYNDALGSIARERQDLKKFLLQHGGKLMVPMSMTTFANSGVRTTNLTLNGTALAKYVEQSKSEVRAMGSASGAYGAMERGARSLQVLEEIANSAVAKRPGRKLLIWMGGGWPIVTSPILMEGRTAKQQDATFAQIVEVNNLLRQNRITFYLANAIHTDNLGQDTIARSFLKGVAEPKSALPGSLLPEVVAVQSGGRVLQVSSDLTDDLNQFVQDLNAYYPVVFDTPSVGHADELHAVVVTVNKPGLTARARTVYYAQP